MDYIKYCNELLSRLETIAYHELSGMIHWKCEFVGVDFIRSKQIEGKTVDEIVTSCSKEIAAAGIVNNIAHKVGKDGIMLKLRVKGCVHHAKEAQTKKEGVAPYLCPIANMILDQVHEKLKYTTSYLAKLGIDADNKQCLVYMALYETADKIVQVSDWLADDEDVEFLASQPSQILAPKM
jgi:nitrogenase subunit NifH